MFLPGLLLLASWRKNRHCLFFTTKKQSQLMRGEHRNNSRTNNYNTAFFDLVSIGVHDRWWYDDTSMMMIQERWIIEEKWCDHGSCIAFHFVTRTVTHYSYPCAYLTSSSAPFLSSLRIPCWLLYSIAAFAFCTVLLFCCGFIFDRGRYFHDSLCCSLFFVLLIYKDCISGFKVSELLYMGHILWNLWHFRTSF